ncbi:MAG: peptide methionine sulfoxide reductase [Osedax symbiont Rs2]|nr:MAG: peptide methionine sulfoxide reductase [Osedax symbiont Rs2]
MSDFSFFAEPKPITSASKLGRDQEIETATSHFVSGRNIKAPFADSLKQAVFGFGCFWSAELKMWQQEGVWTTAVGYIAGSTVNPNYREVCSGFTGHCTAVLVVFDPALVSYQQLLEVFWQSHNPTQGMRQGNDVGTQYRSGIYTYCETQLEQALASRQDYQQALTNAGIMESITTEVQPASHFYYAEEYHQQYSAKGRGGYCGLVSTASE